MPTFWKLQTFKAAFPPLTIETTIPPFPLAVSRLSVCCLNKLVLLRLSSPFVARPFPLLLTFDADRAAAASCEEALLKEVSSEPVRKSCREVSVDEDERTSS